MRVLAACVFASLVAAGAVNAATQDETRKFLHGYRHAYCPYPLPAETTLDEIRRVAEHGFDAIGIGFAGPYRDGKPDWSKLDEAVAMLAKDHRKCVIHLNPRFLESERISDVLSDGRRIDHKWNASPNYAITDIFDPRQRRKFCDHLSLAAEHYGNDPDVIGFVFGWGYMGETGFYVGDFLTDFEVMGSVSAGYSSYALAEYNRWRDRRGQAPVHKLPLPSAGTQSDDYIDWTHFRYWYAGEVFGREAVDAMKAKTSKPIGTQAYLPASNECYARAWALVPNADFLRSAGSASSFDNTRTLQDSAIGWEDAWLHDGDWDFTAARMICDEARMIAKGATFHAMYARVYDTEPQWEKDVYGKVCGFLRTQELSREIRQTRATVALFQPTWASAALPGRSEKQPFIPTVGHRRFISWMVGLVESFGLPYKLITEEDLLDSRRLKGYNLIIVPMSDYAPRFLGKERASELLADRRVLGIPLRAEPVPRSELREMLKGRTNAVLDYDGETPTAGMVNNLVFNWTPKPMTVRVLRQGRWEEVALGPNAYQIIR